MKTKFLVVLFLAAVVFASGCVSQQQSSPQNTKFSFEGDGGGGRCTCGCNLELELCRVKHPRCPVSNP